uniref:Vomeronasal type-1 receptor n=1 Tax=Leopardus wiedii TaxID=61382 RepID=A0A0A0Y856_LEOWI|nr:vomeronasal receptor type I [Leopardus wiedii]
MQEPGSEEEFHSLGFYRMTTRDLTMAMIFFLQTTVGLLGNFSVFYYYLFLYLTGYKLRCTDLILKYLTVANLLVIFSKGIPQTMASFGLTHFLDDFGCRLVFFVHRVGRDVAIGTTCLLTVFQVIMISPGDSRWAQLKIKAPKYVGTSNIFCWVLNIVRSIVVPFHLTDKRNNINTTRKIDQDYCYAVSDDKITELYYVPLLLSHDGFCLGLMLWASCSMVFILHRHKQRVQYIHRNNLSPRSSPESRATRSILVLACFFLSLWMLSSIFHICLSVFNNSSLWLRNTSTLLTVCFPTLSPYIFMSYDPRVSTLYSAWIRKQNPLNLP